jgi:hypothetical protein
VAAGKVGQQPVAGKVMGLPGGRGSPIEWLIVVSGGQARSGSPVCSRGGKPAGQPVDVKEAEQVALRAVSSPQKVLRSLAPRIGLISAVAFSPDGMRLAVGGEGAPAPVLLDVNSGKILLRGLAPSDSIPRGGSGW